MKYMSMVNGENTVEELTKERARVLLERAYDKGIADTAINSGKGFRLRTMTREIWTVTDNGFVPMPGFYGVCD